MTHHIVFRPLRHTSSTWHSIQCCVVVSAVLSSLHKVPLTCRQLVLMSSAPTPPHVQSELPSHFIIPFIQYKLYCTTIVNLLIDWISWLVLKTFKIASRLTMIAQWHYCFRIAWSQLLPYFPKHSVTNNYYNDFSLFCKTYICYN